jgi:hypothetical protein
LSALKPGWVEQFARANPGDTDEHQRIRARGGKPFRTNGWGTRCEATLRGARKSKPRGKDRLERALGPVEEDE